ncbi:hypothetical protein F5H01DRAFT_171007 [Linnemannia elongata]|nr:hypothetical protein F5H01DRAFT_171007 [Linnemannia elongata]
METFNRTFRHFMKTITPVSATTFFFFEAIGPPPLPAYLGAIYLFCYYRPHLLRQSSTLHRSPSFVFINPFIFLFLFLLFFFALFNTSPVNSSFLTPFFTYVLLPLFVLFVFLSVLYS